MDAGRHPELIPDALNPRFLAFFGWYSRRLIRRRFASVRVLRGTLPHLAAHAADPRPLIVAMNHSSWWDPLVGLLLARTAVPERCPLAPMDAAQLRRFRFFRRLGVFGIHPDDPASLPAMTAFVAARFASADRPTLWITPQGEFTDPRVPIRVRPGVAAVASALDAAAPPHARPAAVAIALEYAFWQEARPEIFIALEPCPTPHSPSTPAWHRAITLGMSAAADKLARAVASRDAAALEPLLTSRNGRARSSTNSAYDLLLRLRGRAGGLTTGAQRRGKPTPTS